MKSPLFLLVFFSLPALASAPRDALLGRYEGNGCHLAITPTAQGNTDLTFTDSSGERTLWGVGRPLEAQLAHGANPLVFDHQRQSLGDMTIHLEITLSGGRPVAMSGTGWGWGGNTRIGCAFER